MAFYNTCPLCGGNLDPGERCDCIQEELQKEQAMKNMLKVGKSNQLEFNFLTGGSRNEKAVI